MRERIVPELDDARMTIERGLDDTALHAASSTVDEPHLAEAGRRRRVDVLGNHGRYVARREGVQIQFVLDWDLDRPVRHWRSNGGMQTRNGNDGRHVLSSPLVTRLV